MAANKSIYIVDASVVLKWFLEESDFQKEALALRHDYFKKEIELGIPHTAFAEVLNTLGRKCSGQIAISYFSMLLEYGFIEHGVTLESSSIALGLMEKFPGISFYDSLYHAIALHEGGTFITADEKYYRKTYKEGSIMLLKDYGKKR